MTLQRDYAYSAFLSYSGQDRRTAKRLQRALEEYRIPAGAADNAQLFGGRRGRIGRVFRDRSELAASHDLRARIEEALCNSAFLIVLCSPSAAESRWVNEEIVWFRDLHGPERILTVIADKSPTRAYEECFPPALRYRLADGELSAEPIAADLRAGGDGWRIAKLKLIAGILGVGLDDLVHRDERRRHRWLAGIAAGSTAGMALTTVLAVSAVLARNEARAQKRQAESLVAFMLTDLRKRLEPTNGLDIMDGVATRALKYYGSRDAAPLDPGSQEIWANALRLRGEIDLLDGSPSRALTSFKRAAEITGPILAADPRDAKSIFSHAQSIYWLGEVAREQSRPLEAEAKFREYLRLAQRLVALDTSNDEWRNEEADAEADLGVLMSQADRGQEAADDFRAALRLFQELARSHQDADHLISVAQMQAYLADALEAAGQLDAARRQRLQEVDIYSRLLSSSPNLQQPRYSKMVAAQALARNAMLRGDWKESIDDAADAAQEAETLSAGDPANTGDEGVAGVAEAHLAEALLASGQVDSAAQVQVRADAMLARARGRGDASEDLRAYQAESDLVAAAVDRARGKLTAASAADRRALTEASSMPASGINTRGRWLLDSARLGLGDDIYPHARNDALSQWRTVVADLSSHEGHLEPRQRLVLTACRARLRSGDPRRAPLAIPGVARQGLA